VVSVEYLFLRFSTKLKGELKMSFLSKISANAADGIGDHLGKFWLVLEPSSKSVIEDILTLTNIAGVMNLALGGLSITEVIGIYPKEQKAKAEKHANDVLAQVKA